MQIFLEKTKSTHLFFSHIHSVLMQADLNKVFYVRFNLLDQNKKRQWMTEMLLSLVSVYDQEVKKLKRLVSGSVLFF